MLSPQDAIIIETTTGKIVAPVPSSTSRCSPRSRSPALDRACCRNPSQDRERPIEATLNRGSTTMRLSLRVSVGTRGFAVISGVACVVGLSLAAAWSKVAARRPIEPRLRVCIRRPMRSRGRRSSPRPGRSSTRDDRGAARVDRGGRADQGRGGPLRRRDDRRQGAGRLSRVHRPVHDGRPARRGRAVGDRQGPPGRPGRGAAAVDAARQPPGS